MDRRNKPGVSRRAVLKGLGTAAALPVLARAGGLMAAGGTPRVAPAPLRSALRAAMADFEAEVSLIEREQVWALIRRAHQELAAVVATATPVPGMPGVHRVRGEITHPELAQVWSALRGEAPPMGPAARGDTLVTDNGVLISVDKYATLDPGWITAAVVWLRYFLHAQTVPGVVVPYNEMPDTGTVALVGDWGTGFYRPATNPAPAENVANMIKARSPGAIIHLGDVYYSGLPDPNRTQFPESETKNFLEPWPGKVGASYALNSNHDMIPGGWGYYPVVLADPRFDKHGGASSFWLENGRYIILGLDSAGFASRTSMYADGTINDDDQIALIEKAAGTGKRLILLTHHNGLSEDGQRTNDLWEDVASLVEGTETWWYWGHAHVGAVYKERALGRGVIRARCSGHGGIPWGEAPALMESDQVEWVESDNAGDDAIEARVMNGFTLLTFTGPTLREDFIDEVGVSKWHGTTT